MRIIWAQQEIPYTTGPNIFLAGPTLRQRVGPCPKCQGTGGINEYGSDGRILTITFNSCPECEGKGQAPLISWRLEAIELLEEKCFTGHVYIPEPEGFVGFTDLEEHSYEAQVEWEHKGLRMADTILFWVPRDLRLLPGFTTNIEFGMYYNDPMKCVLGYPEDAPKMKYLRYLAEDASYPVPVAHTLERTVENAIKNAIGDLES